MKLIGILVGGWKNLSTFMIECSQTHKLNDVWWGSYGEQVKLFPYLPEVEEARSWLEKCYSDSQVS